MRVRAFAKINLSLRVLGTRDDGYHQLRTIFQSIALHDTLTIRRRRGAFGLTSDDPACPSDESNLVWRAADRMWKAAGRSGAPRDISVDLKKRIPLQAGLGGGSSDAAAALRVFARLWRVRDPMVRAAAAQLGADVPYFLEGGTALGLERGDLLFPLIDYPPAWIVLVLPAFGVSTKDAFTWWSRGPAAPKLARASGASAGGSRRSDGSPGSNGLVGSGSAGRWGSKRAWSSAGWSGSAEPFVNDLQSPVATHHPQIARIVGALRGQGAIHAAMSGSGSAVFGVFERRTQAARAAAALASRSSRASKVCHTVMTRTLNRSKYQRLAAT
jgi:4-diphosphocytidyl-2-C-methyl-D-erythritol kinase